MQVTQTPLPGVLLVDLDVYGDERGFFVELFSSERYAMAGISASFVQSNYSRSVKGTLRGLHFQEPHAQGKLIQVISGTVFDVAVDVRKGSPTFGRWFGVRLTSEQKRQLWVPAGFAHGFCALSDTADLLYQCTELYSRASERSVAWNDPAIGIDWPIRDPIISPKDASAPRLADAPMLPTYSGS